MQRTSDSQEKAEDEDNDPLLDLEDAEFDEEKEEEEAAKVNADEEAEAKTGAAAERRSRRRRRDKEKKIKLYAGFIHWSEWLAEGKRINAELKILESEYLKTRAEILERAAGKIPPRSTATPVSPALTSLSGSESTTRRSPRFKHRHKNKNKPVDISQLDLEVEEDDEQPAAPPQEAPQGIRPTTTTAAKPPKLPPRPLRPMHLPVLLPQSGSQEQHVFWSVEALAELLCHHGLDPTHSPSKTASVDKIHKDRDIALSYMIDFSDVNKFLNGFVRNPNDPYSAEIWEFVGLRTDGETCYRVFARYQIARKSVQLSQEEKEREEKEKWDLHGSESFSLLSDRRFARI